MQLKLILIIAAWILLKVYLISGIFIPSLMRLIMKIFCLDKIKNNKNNRFTQKNVISVSRNIVRF